MRFEQELVKPDPSFPAGAFNARCIFYPQIGPSHPDGFIVPAGLIDGFYMTPVSVVAIREIAKKFPQVGLVPRDEHDALVTELAEAKAELEEAREQMKVYDAELDAISTLEGRGYRTRKKAS